jgi:hypothetical protein
MFLFSIAYLTHLPDYRKKDICREGLPAPSVRFLRPERAVFLAFFPIGQMWVCVRPVYRHCGALRGRN